MIVSFKKTFFILLCFSFLIFSCKKEYKPHVDVINNPFQPAAGNVLFSGTSVSARIGVIVTDQNNAPVANAQVVVGNQTGTTNQEGVFQFTNVSVDKSRAYVKVTKSGYFLGSRSFIPSSSATNYVQIELISKTSAGSINNSNGGVVTLTSGASLTFEPGDVSLANGSPYSGNVTVYASYLDPMANNLGRIMPGDLAALNLEGEEVTLETFGMIAVELKGSNGQALNVSSGETVELKMPVSSQQTSNAPMSIPLWYFDEVNGNWVEEGEAVLQGNNYVGEVAHFSFWNCDAPFPVIDFECRVVCNGTPVQNATVKIIMPSGSAGYGNSNGNGVVSGKIASGVSLTLQVLDVCGSVVYTQSIPASSSNVNLGDLNACSSSSATSISGSITNCNGGTVVNGMVKIELSPNVSYFYFTNSLGQFSGVFSNCASVSNLSVVAFDLTNNLQSTPTTVATNTTINLGAISTCNQIDEYINYTIDGTAYVANDLGQNEVYSIYGTTPQDSTGIYGYSLSGYLGLTSPGTSPLIIGNNTFDLGYLHAYQLQFPSTLNVNLTTLGTTPGSYMEGTFSGTFAEQNGNTHTISGNFRTKNE